MEPRFQFGVARMLYAMTFFSVAAAAMAIGIRWTAVPAYVSFVGDLLAILCVLTFSAGVGVLFGSPWLGIKYAVAGWGAYGVLILLCLLFASLLGI